MSNDYFNDPSDIANYTSARPTEINQQFANIAAGFDLVPSPTVFGLTVKRTVTAGGTANAITIDNATDVASYVMGQRISLKAIATNTTAATVNVDGLGVKTIKRQNGDDVAAGDITSGRVCDLIYDGTYFQLVGVTTGQLSDQVTLAAAQVALATTQAGNAATSASAASTSASAAETAETNAETAETNAEAAAAAAAASAVAAEAAIGADWVEVASASLTGSAVDLTSIPQTSEDLLIVIEAASHNSGSNQSLQAQFSGDNGSTWTGTYSFGISQAATVTWYGGVMINGYRKNAGVIRGVAMNLTSDNTGAADSTPGTYAWRIASGIDAIRITLSGGSFDGSGTVKLFAR